MKRYTLTQRQWNHVEMTPECWIWRGPVSSDGYGVTSHTAAHRAFYQALVGPIPPGHHVDHECHNLDGSCVNGSTCPHRRCVRPSHLKAVPADVNRRNQWGRRKTHCHLGHEFTLENTYVGPAGVRQCRKCQSAAVARYKARKRQRGKAS